MADAPKPFHNPFAALAPLRGRLPEASPKPEAPRSPAPAVTPVKGPARAVARIERTGRGGKEVTVIDHLGLAPRELESWLKALKSALGCGGVIEGTAIVLQGDHRARIEKVLTAKGVRKVTLGS